MTSEAREFNLSGLFSPLFLYNYGDRSKVPCKEFLLRRPFMLCWEPSRKFFFEFAKVTCLFAKNGRFMSFPDKGILINNHT